MSSPRIQHGGLQVSFLFFKFDAAIFQATVKRKEEEEEEE